MDEQCAVHSEQLKNIKEDVSEIKTDIKEIKTIKQISLINQHDILWIKRIALFIFGSGGVAGLITLALKIKNGG